MAPRRKVRARETQLAFEALAIEGGQLSPEWLSKVAQQQAAQQTDADYRIHKGLALRDEIGRYWRIAQAHWSDFNAGRQKAADPGALADRFVLGLLRDAFGFGTIAGAAPVTVGGRTYPIGHAALEGRVPVVIAPAGSGLDTLSPAFGEEGRRRSAFGLAQEYLNADDRALWGLATDGVTLRLCRDNVSLTRPAWIEADLGRVFVEERYADFAALWLLIHESRFGAPGQPLADCPLEAWRSSGREEGTRAREKLREGVEDALVALGRGFLTHADNQALRSALHAGQLTRDAYFQQLLRLVYRVIFLLTAEERAVLHPPDAGGGAKELYESGYSLRRLRDRSAKRSAHDRFGDLWEGLKITFRGVATGQPILALPALGGLFAKDQCPDLDVARLENRWLMAAIFKLAWVREESGLARVNWRDMGPEELGSVYESLLELVPLIPQDGRGFSFATGGETKGNARKTTGSYYTPDGLVQVLLDSALEPVLQATVAAHPEDPAEALLKLAVVDPACGSGHFLLAAARRLAVHVARHQANGTPSAEQYRHAVRQVVSRCLFGVDLNPMAVELCRVSLWMEAVEPGRPLSFLDSHVQRGNALLGATPELMKKGIPDAAFEPIEGDDKKTASLLKKRNKEVSEKQGLFDTLWSKQAGAETDEVARAVADLDAAPDADLAAVAGKEARWDELQASEAFRHQKFVADAWCAAFVWPKPELESTSGGKQKKASPIVEAAPTNALWLQIQSGKGQPPALTVKTVEDLTVQYHFFHWHLAFPQVFARGGFDVVLGNPPWERVSLKEKEWFAERDPEVAGAATGASRLKMIAGLADSNPRLLAEFREAKRAASGEKHLLRKSGRYPLCGQGDVNTFAVFAELGRWAACGRTGMVLPTGIVTADTTQDFVADIVKRRELASVFDFDNRSGIFPAVQGNVRFCLLTMGRGVQSSIRAAAQLRSTEDLRNAGRVWTLAADDVERINPNTLTIPLFPSDRDAAIVRDLYVRVPCLDADKDRDETWRWNVPMQRMLHMGDDSHLFKTDEQLSAEGFRRVGHTWESERSKYVPLLEAKLCHQFDHRDGTFDGIPHVQRFGTHPATREMTAAEHLDADSQAEPRYWVPAAEVKERISERSYLLAYRDAVSAVADSRSLAATLVPAHGAGHTLLFFFPSGGSDAAFICSWVNAFATDYVFRLKSTGAHASFYLVRQLPAPTRAAVASRQTWANDKSALEWVVPRVLELTYTAWDLQPFAKDVGYQGPPFIWDPSRRFLLRAELDAIFFHLYGISRDDADYILDTFPIVRKYDEKTHGEYRTKRVILEIYDAMAEAIRTGKPYQTRLDPPPADPRVAHSQRSGKH